MTELIENIDINEKKKTPSLSPKKPSPVETSEICESTEPTTTTSHKNPLLPPEFIEPSSAQLKAGSSSSSSSKKVSSSSTPKRSHKKASTKDKDAPASESGDKDAKRKSSLQEVANVSTPSKHTRRIRRSSSNSSLTVEDAENVKANSEDKTATAKATTSSSSEEKKKKKSKKTDGDKKKKSKENEAAKAKESEDSASNEGKKEDEEIRPPNDIPPPPLPEENGDDNNNNGEQWTERDLTEREVAAGRVILRVLRSAAIHRRWHELVAAYAHSPASKSGRKRLCIIRELISTERSYTSSLTTLVNQYIFPLKVEAMKRNGIISKENLDKIFANIEEINCLNMALLRDLDTVMRGAPGGGLPIGATMLPHLRVFSMYSLYVNSYTAGAELLAKLRRTSKPLAAFLQAAADRTAEPLDITSYLIMPVQRIPRYKLLLEDLVRHTDESDRDRDALIMCLAEVRALAEKINERRRLADSNAKLVEIQAHLTERIELLQPARRFVREDRFAVEASVKGLAAKSAPTLFLFNDSLLYVDKLDSGKLRYRGFWPLTDITLTESVPYSFAPADAVRMFILSCEKIHRGRTELIVTADSAETKASWVADFAEHKAFQIDRNEKMRISAVAAEEGGISTIPVAATTSSSSAAVITAAGTPAGPVDCLSPLPSFTPNSNSRNNSSTQLRPLTVSMAAASPALTGSGRARSNTFSGRRGAPLASSAASVLAFNASSSPTVDDDADKEIVIVADVAAAAASAATTTMNTSVAVSRHGRNYSSSAMHPQLPSSSSLEQSSSSSSSSSSLSIPPPLTTQQSSAALASSSSIIQQQQQQHRRSLDDQEVPRTPLRRNMYRRASEKIEISSRLCDDIPPPPPPPQDSTTSVSTSKAGIGSRRALSSSGGRRSSNASDALLFPAAATAAAAPPKTPSSNKRGSFSGFSPSSPVPIATPSQEQEARALDLTELLREEARVIEEIRAEYRAAIEATSRLELATQQCAEAESLVSAHAEQSSGLQRRLDEERRRLSALKEARSAAQKRTAAAQKALSAASERLVSAQARTHAAEREAAALTAQLHDAQRRQRQLADENAAAEARADAANAEARTLTARCERAEAACTAAAAQVAELRDAVAAAEAACARAAERKGALAAEVARAEDAADELAGRARKLARERRAAEAERAQMAESLAAAEAARDTAERGAAQLERERRAAAEELEELEAREGEGRRGLEAAQRELKALGQRAHAAQRERKEAEKGAEAAVEGLAEVRRRRAELVGERGAMVVTRETLDAEMARARERCAEEHARCAAALAEIERVQAETSVVRGGNESWSAALAQIKDAVIVCKEKVRQVDELACTLGTYADNFARHRAQVEEAFSKLV